MKLIILFCTLMLIATTGLAAKQEKVLICHVGNEVGLGGETYLDDPTCVPTDANGYFCPDAGKIDLIVTAKPAKHLNNPSHSWDGISDYEPSEVGASGDGTEDSDGNGVDDGCEPAEECPCWAEAELQAVTAANSFLSCDPRLYPIGVLLINQEGTAGFAAISNPDAPNGPVLKCENITSDPVTTHVTQAVADICVAQLAQRCADIGHPVIPD